MSNRKSKIRPAAERSLAEIYVPIWESELAKCRKVEETKPAKGGSQATYDTYLERCFKASDDVERVEKIMTYLRAETLDDVAAQSLIALARVDAMRDYHPTEQHVAELGAEALRLLYSIVFAMRRLGYLNVSEELFARHAAVWRSPWLSVREADREHAKACGLEAGRCSIDEQSPARTFFDKRVPAIDAGGTSVAP
jgi:hypothetical protein